jgi:single-stranded DNA-binding protein
MPGADPDVIRELMALHSYTAGVLPRTIPQEAPVPEQRSQDPLVCLTGNVGKTPVERQTRSGTVVGFSFAVKTGYNDDQPPQWFDVSVWNEGLQAYVMQNFGKGMAVAVEGFYSTYENNGYTNHQINAQRVGLVEWGTRSKRGETVAAPAAAATPRAAASSDDGEW